MKSFKTYITEILDNPFDYAVVSSGYEKYRALFITEKTKVPYKVAIDLEEIGEGSENEKYFAIISFSKLINSGIEDLVSLKVNWRSLQTDIKIDPNVKDPEVARIFATVIQITKNFSSNAEKIYDIEYYVFEAAKSEPSRVKLYDRLSNRLSKELKLRLNRIDGKEFVRFELGRNISEDFIDESLQDWLRNIVLAAGLFSANDLEAEKLSPIPVERTNKTKKIISNPRSTLMTVKADTPEERLALLKKMAISSGLKGAELNHFLSQAQHETLGYSKLEEIGSVSKFEKKYGSDTRKGKILGNVSPGDGAKFRGRGFLQLTGKYNYDKIGKMLNLDLVSNPSMVSRYPGIAAATAIAYWKWRVAPRVKSFTSKDAVERVTKQIAGSGKEKHLDRRKRLLRKDR
jgi:predicted chitinase